MRRLTGESQSSKPSQSPRETPTSSGESALASSEEKSLSETSPAGEAIPSEAEQPSPLSQEERGTAPDGASPLDAEGEGDASEPAHPDAGETSGDDEGETAPHEGGWRLEIPDEPLPFAVIPEELPGEIVPLEEVRRPSIVEPPPAEEEEAAGGGQGETAAQSAEAQQGSSQQTAAREALGYTLCLRCFGGGEITTPAICPSCLGAREDWCEGISIPCRVCHGTGRVNVPCPECNGQGWRRQEPEPADTVADTGHEESVSQSLPKADPEEHDEETFLGSSELQNGHIRHGAGATDSPAPEEPLS